MIFLSHFFERNNESEFYLFIRGDELKGSFEKKPLLLYEKLNRLWSSIQVQHSVAVRQSWRNFLYTYIHWGQSEYSLPYTHSKLLQDNGKAKMISVHRASSLEHLIDIKLSMLELVPLKSKTLLAENTESIHSHKTSGYKNVSFPLVRQETIKSYKFFSHGSITIVSNLASFRITKVTT